MNEIQTRFDKIDPALKAAGWGVVPDSRVVTEYKITNGRVSKTSKPNPLKADYILSYKGVKLAVVEALHKQSNMPGFSVYALPLPQMATRYTASTWKVTKRVRCPHTRHLRNYGIGPLEMLMNGGISSTASHCIPMARRNLGIIKKLPSTVH